MRTKALLIFVLLIFLAIPQNMGAQEDPDLGFGWSIEVDKPIIFIGDYLTGHISSRFNQSDYDIYLFNRTSGNRMFFYSGLTNYNGNSSFKKLMIESLFIPGRYFLNVTVNNVTVAYTELTIIYNEAFLVKLWRFYVDNTLRWMVSGFKDLELGHLQQEDRLDDLDTLTFILYVLLVIISEFVFVFVILPIIRVWLNRMSRKGDRAKQLKPIRGSVVQWHDLLPKRIPDKSRPNTKSVTEIVQKLKLAGIKDIDIKQMLWTTAGSPATMIIGKGWILNHPLIYLMMFICFFSFIIGAFVLAVSMIIIIIVFIALFQPRGTGEPPQDGIPIVAAAEKIEEDQEPEPVDELECPKCNCLYPSANNNCPICSIDEAD